MDTCGQSPGHRMTPQECAERPELLTTDQPLRLAKESAASMSLFGWRSAAMWTLYHGLWRSVHSGFPGVPVYRETLCATRGRRPGPGAGRPAVALACRPAGGPGPGEVAPRSWRPARPRPRGERRGRAQERAETPGPTRPGVQPRR